MAGADPASYSDKQAYDAISSGFGPGANSPFTIVIQPGHGASSAQVQQLAGTLRTDLAAAPGVAAVSPVQASQDGAILVTTVVPSSRPQDQTTGTLLGTLRGTTLLSMDYEVFLLSRIRESWTATLDNHASVAAGLAATARVITCAALIMARVFLSFLLSTNVVVKMLALGLGASVLIDATMIRLVVVPATMFLLGRYNWWIPHWLDRALPHLESEGPPART
jgi:uncharacterized membrane protein YdfJ with MMPL/SSD domain